MTIMKNHIHKLTQVGIMSMEILNSHKLLFLRRKKKSSLGYICLRIHKKSKSILL